MSITLVVVLVVFGVLLLLAEIFLLPGLGLAGIAGLASLGGAVAIAYMRISAIAGHITLGACVLLTALAIYAFIRGKALEKMALDTSIDSTVELASPGKKIEKLQEEAEKIENK